MQHAGRSLVEIAGRPEKPVSCPRCESWNTKFCYYNNNNVNQPRHFCKGCHRYWTEGGSLRNVPVGAGKRKVRLNQSTPPTIPVKVSKTPDIFYFTGSDLGHGMHTSSGNSSCDGSSRQQAESKPLELLGVASAAESMLPSVQASNLHSFAPGISPQCTGASYDAATSHKQPFQRTDISEAVKKEAPFLDLNLSKEIGALESEGVVSSSHTAATDQLPSMYHINAKQDLSQPLAERDESTCCSAFTAAIGSAVTDSSNTGCTRPGVELSSVVGNAGLVWGALMWPWVWPFLFNGDNFAPPAGVPQVGSVCGSPQVDAHLAAAIGAMAYGGLLPPVHPAIAAAMSAMAAGHMPQLSQTPQLQQGSQIPQMSQISPNLSAALASSLFQMPQLWNPFAWGLPWAAAWNTGNVGWNPPNDSQKRPRSHTPEQGSTPKTARVDATVKSTILNNGSDVPSSTHPVGCFDASQTKVDGFQAKHTAPEHPEEHSDSYQHQSPHTNPAAQIRSAAFQESS